MYAKSKHSFLDIWHNGSCLSFILWRKQKTASMIVFVWSSYNLFSVTGYSFQRYYSESREIDTISRVHGELDELKNIMVKNIGELVIKFYNSHHFLLSVSTTAGGDWDQNQDQEDWHAKWGSKGISCTVHLFAENYVTCRNLLSLSSHHLSSPHTHPLSIWHTLCFGLLSSTITNEWLQWDWSSLLKWQ